MRIYETALDMVRSVAALSRKVERHDADLARQMRRACVSVPLNINEGNHSLGGNKRARFHTAMGSARETLACLQIAAAVGYVGEGEIVEDADRLDHIVAVLWKLSRVKR